MRKITNFPTKTHTGKPASKCLLFRYTFQLSINHFTPHIILGALSKTPLHADLWLIFQEYSLAVVSLLCFTMMIMSYLERFYKENITVLLWLTVAEE